MELKKSLSTVIREYGPINGPISHERVSELLKKGEHKRMLCIIHTPGGSDTLWGLSGHHFVNVLERYEAYKPLPDNMWVYDIHFGDGGLQSP